MIFSLFYTLGIRCYILLLHVAALYYPKARLMVAGRRTIDEDTAGFLRYPGRSVWFHCASVGEFEQGYPLLKLLRNAFPQYRYHITFYSPSGYTFVQKKYPQESISYLPFDTPEQVEHFVRRIRPRAVFIVKYEYWFQLLRTLHRHEIPVLMVSAILRPNHFLFRPIGFAYRPLLRKIRHFFVQNEQSLTLLQHWSIPQVTLTGDTRFDRVMEHAQEPLVDEKVREFAAGARLFIGGSVWDTDIPVLKQLLAELPFGWKIILAPHDPSHFDVSQLSESVDFYTQVETFRTRILVLDMIGLLASVYRLADFSYVGGGFGKGLHNILEPAVFGKPILIGENYRHFNEAVELVARGCAFPLKQGEHPKELVQKIISNEAFTREISHQMETYISANTNVSDKIAVFVSKEHLL